ncbi:MAG: cobyric acid synthase [Fusobacterium sp. JB021]|nr:cobyric acid synthase [Fusobacterium sp. JB020]MDP0494436.1 cobyric acid synthase [Fusobacterium sp. JB021]
MHKKIMLQGTGSSVGKSILTAGLCRIFSQDGYKVAPFKSQNMALNSYVDIDGYEMSRAQVVQAEAANTTPKAFMNPILLKPTGEDDCSQVILEGKPFKNMNAAEYYKHYKKFREIAITNYSKIQQEYEIGVLEGAGSPAEINLRTMDIANMGIASAVKAPVVLIADVERGGVFASIYGTIMLLRKSDRKKIKGYIINKFRGDISLLEKGIKMLDEVLKKENISVPCLGVIPYFDINIEDEDSYIFNAKEKKEVKDINIAVVQFGKLSNSTDFNSFLMYDDVNLVYVSKAEDLNDDFDMIILPGSKNAIYDYSIIKERQITKKITDLAEKGKVIVGIHSGFQMLGKSIKDLSQVESSYLKIECLGFFDVKTKMETDKYTKQVSRTLSNCTGILEGFDGLKVSGYELHQGITTGDNSSSVVPEKDFSILCKDNIIGTYIHGIFDSAKFTRKLLNKIRIKKGLEPIYDFMSLESFKEKEYRRLARVMRSHLDMEAIYKILK